MLTKKEFCLLNELNSKRFRERNLKDSFLLLCISEYSNIALSLVEKGFLDASGAITDLGVRELEPYRVKNAVILAAGPSTRMVPLSLEKPKGLFEVKGEVLIERQIRQLQEVGITDITVVLGYKKEQFYYLKEKFNVEFVINDNFVKKNNTESMRLIADKLCNTYVCSCDDYFLENPFNQYECDSFYAGYYTFQQTNEMYVELDYDKNIVHMLKGKYAGFVLVGHSYFNSEFSRKFKEILLGDKEGKYDQLFWEWIVKDNLEILPSFAFKEYLRDEIYEFDFFDELRDFDESYIERTQSRIIKNITSVFKCTESDVKNFRTVKEGLTNTSFIFELDGVDYIYRHPGDGTEEIISRQSEQEALILAKQLEIDPTYIYMDVNEGWKISKFVHNFREPEYESFEDSKLVLTVLRDLHSATIRPKAEFKPWDESIKIKETLINDDAHCFDDYFGLEANIKKLVEKVENDGTKKCFCHCDTYRHNWMITDEKTILIDWEYAGFSDPGVDIGYYICDAEYDFDEAEKFVKEYAGKAYNADVRFHHFAYTAIIAYYWFVWALYREACGADMGESLGIWRDVAKKYSDYLLK